MLLSRDYRLMLHSADPMADSRDCVVRTAAGLVSRCAAMCGTPLTAETMHIHAVDSRGIYEGYCSEGCAMRGLYRPNRLWADDVRANLTRNHDIARRIRG